MIEDRKLDHISLSLSKEVESAVDTGFRDIIPVHRALPEQSLDEIDTSTSFFGKKLKAPLVIAGMTGGHEKAMRINEALATAAQEVGVAMGVGSQRAAIEDRGLGKTYSVVREAAPDAFLIANLGAVQFGAGGYTIEEAEKAVSMIEADALAIHLNPLHEAVQPEGDRDFRGCLEAVAALEGLSVPWIAKETGAGISRTDAKAIEKAGAAGIDVGGLGGTSFAAVESYREGADRELAQRFRDWGIPTAASTIEVLEATSLPVISTGGLRDGVDLAKALALGAAAGGMALPLLKEAVKGPEAVKKKLSHIIGELKTAMFLMGAGDIDGLRKSDLVIMGRTREWLEARGIDHRRYANRNIYK
ncbi:MAG: type 2 isopentenyl-diphosphate Delta-isomerase [Methanobacteriota archaeon]|nr:MAG: type 2 isopentenyl-diphosphate Delta-isomerase [Euryarchaeota archaeon]